MFGYIGENTTTHSGNPNRADVNELVYLFVGKGVWLNSHLTHGRPVG